MLLFFRLKVGTFPSGDTSMTNKKGYVGHPKVLLPAQIWGLVGLFKIINELISTDT